VGEAEPTTSGIEPSPELLNGWCRTAPSLAEVYRPTVAGEVKGVLDAAPERGVIARGLGRSYGDPAQNAGGAVIDLTRMSGLRALDLERGIVTAWAGTSIDELLRWLVPLGWFVPVTPGTRFVTVGGAIGSDIHGKGHHVDGTWGAHVHALTIQMATGEVRTLTPTDAPEEFWATVGGLGLTGIVLDATFDLVPIETSLMSVHTERAKDLDDLMAKMVEGDDAHHYSVAWLDILARGASLGRGVLGRGDHARLDELPAKKRARPLDYRAEMRLSAPPWIPHGLVNPLSVSAFNEVWFRKAPVSHHGIESIPTFWHPLDGVARWNRVYGPRGFLQYQFVVPFSQGEVVRVAVERLSAARTASFLTVLKTFGPANPGPLSFPSAGWTLAIDAPVGDPSLAALLDGLDELVIEAGGSVYLAKDSRLQPELLPALYPRLDEWRAVRERMDPDHVLQSDLARRLGL
jgi:decaprenylphospho-beta-D-ribofuranose 2-oxidase